MKVLTELILPLIGLAVLALVVFLATDYLLAGSLGSMAAVIRVACWALLALLAIVVIVRFCMDASRRAAESKRAQQEELMVDAEVIEEPGRSWVPSDLEYETESVDPETFAAATAMVAAAAADIAAQSGVNSVDLVAQVEASARALAVEPMEEYPPQVSEAVSEYDDVEERSEYPSAESGVAAIATASFVPADLTGLYVHAEPDDELGYDSVYEARSVAETYKAAETGSSSKEVEPGEDSETYRTMVENFNLAQLTRYVSGALVDEGYRVKKASSGNPDVSSLIIKRGTTQALVYCMAGNQLLELEDIELAHENAMRLGCNGVVVATTMAFTREAVVYASENDVTLWDRRDLLDFS